MRGEDAGRPGLTEVRAAAVTSASIFSAADSQRRPSATVTDDHGL